MPIYDFRCPQCSIKEEYFLDLMAGTPKCPKCSMKMERLASAPHFKFRNAKESFNPNSFKSGHKQKPIVPINIVDVNANGTYKVTSTAKDPELLDG